MEESCSISISGSDKLTWDLIDQRMKTLGYKKRSQYFQHLAEQDIFNHKEKMKKRELILYSLVFLTFLALILSIAGVL